MMRFSTTSDADVVIHSEMIHEAHVIAGLRGARTQERSGG
jgi:hypothetical protein